MSLIKWPIIYIILLLLVQKEGSIMQKKLDNLKEKMIFEISYWGGLGKYAGKGGYILTSDYELYEYRINSNPYTYPHP